MSTNYMPSSFLGPTRFADVRSMPREMPTEVLHSPGALTGIGRVSEWYFVSGRHDDEGRKRHWPPDGRRYAQWSAS